MPVKPLPYASLEPLLRDHWVAAEDPGTAELIERLRPARTRGYLTRGELERVCRWKSPRSIALVLENTAPKIRRCTGAALRTVDERERLGALLQLRGVSVPSASAVLTILEPERYGVIDIRVWQLLHAIGAVEGNARGAGFTHDQWLRFLHVVRDLASRLETSARAVERSLFAAHVAHQDGLLYRPSNGVR